MKKKRPVLRAHLIRNGMFLLFQLARVVPEKILYGFVRRMSRLLYRYGHRNRECALRNIALAMGPACAAEEVRAIYARSCRMMGEAVMDSLRYGVIPAEQVRRRIQMEGFEHIRQALAQGRGIVGVSAHLGSFPLLGCRLALEGIPVSFIARRLRERGLEDAGLDFAHRLKLKIIFSRPVITCLRWCMQALNRNELVILAVDQNFGSEGVPIYFFGKTAKVPAGPLTLALRTQAVVLPMFIVRNPDNTHRLIIEAPVALQTGEKKELDERANMQKIVAIIESYIRAHPGQWMSWIHKRWEIAEPPENYLCNY
ncbi:MAG: lysophospholipid acyltransferase family protein [Candidatus Omnitrophica bacterium]|nr:lysophospholipid acyltransferase family protein [Candidatus Omnitrophota bacterium]